MAFFLAIIAAAAAIYGGFALLLGILWIATTWQFWAVLFVLCLIGKASNARRRRVAARTNLPG